MTTDFPVREESISLYFCFPADGDIGYLTDGLLCNEPVDYFSCLIGRGRG